MTIPIDTARQANLTHERLLVLGAGRAERHYWRDLWTYRELIVILAWRCIRKRPTALQSSFVGELLHV